MLINRNTSSFSGLLVLLHLKETGEVKIDKACTESLQSFHKPKRLSNSSPVKAELLKKRSKKICLARDDDPRPKKYRERSKEAFQAEVNMLTVNYCWSTNSDVMWRYKMEKADVQQAAMDHDYDQLLMTEL